MLLSDMLYFYTFVLNKVLDANGYSFRIYFLGQTFTNKCIYSFKHLIPHLLFFEERPPWNDGV